MTDANISRDLALVSQLQELPLSMFLILKDSNSGPNFKRSALKGDPTYEFVPTNLHLQVPLLFSSLCLCFSLSLLCDLKDKIFAKTEHQITIVCVERACYCYC